MRHLNPLRWVVACALAAASSGMRAAEGQAADLVVLDTSTLWRVRTVWETQELLLPSGEVRHARFITPRDAGEFLRKNPDKPEVPSFTVEQLPVLRLPEDTARDWMKLDFDDSTWVRQRGPVLAASNDLNWKLILLRGRFEVPDPAKAADLTFSLAFRGGAVVYLNGDEVARSFMPKGEVALYTPAEPYPRDVSVSAEGFLMYRGERSDGGRARIAQRVRRLDGVTVPAARLRKGVNVLAIAVHRAPTDPTQFLRRPKGSYGCNPPHDDTFWARIGLAEVRLTAPQGAPAAPGTAPPRNRGFVVWNQSIVQTAFIEDLPDPFAPLRPVRLSGVRNGTFAGQLVVGDAKPLKGLKAVVSDLKGPGSIPASAVRVRYALPDGEPPRRGRMPPFDSLEDSPPDEVPVYEQHGGSVQPIWLTLSVPADAKPGDYKGTVAVAAEGVASVEVPLELRVFDWALPDPNAFTARMDIVESPESLAMAYGVELWSDAHWKLLDQAFALLKPLAVKTVYLTAIRRTHWGNEHAMVRWARGKDGELEPNFDIAEKYLDVATKHLGKVPGVILCCWEPMSSMGHAGGAGNADRTNDKPILYTLWDPATGGLKDRVGPAWGTPEAREFWAKFNRGILPLLKKRGLESSTLYGLVGDARPTKMAMDTICTGTLKEQAKWAVHSHYYCTEWQGYPMGMAIALWGIGSVPVDPAEGYGYGWQNPFWLSYYPREMSLATTLVEHRIKIEAWMGAKTRSKEAYAKAIGTRGLGRLGADFWVVLKDARGRVAHSLAGRYPESYWGQLNLNYGVPYLLGKGKTGPVPTVRSEAFRENLQEVEARVLIERALTDEAKKARLGDELAAECRRALDTRIRFCLHSDGEGMPWFVSSDWARRTETLWRLAAEAASKLGGK
ncbi:MAG TPA: glycoside hydrolase domain-containing protein [Planctomycetota bacterium]|nr:glycoside hydrolase domain-containing protein [Planctomycetota bacterium]